MIVSYLTFQNQTTKAWKLIFIITGSLLICTGIIYVIFADSTQQSWSNGKIKKSKNSIKDQSEEMKNLSCNERNLKS